MIFIFWAIGIYILSVIISFFGYALCERIQKEYSPEAVNLSWIPAANLIILVVIVFDVVFNVVFAKININDKIHNLYKKLTGYEERMKNGM